MTFTPDEKIIDDFIDCGCDLLEPFFPEQDHLRLRLRIVAEVTFSDKQLWQEIGCSAFQSLCNGLIRNWGYPAARDWARLLEPLLRKLCDKADIRLTGKEDLGVLLGKTKAKLLEEDRPPYDAVPCLFARARAKDPTDRCTKQFACVIGSDYRNKHGHERWPKTGWRERIEIAEAVLVTLTYMIEKHPEIVPVVVTEQACKQLGRHSAGRTGYGDFDWSWQFRNNDYSATSEELVHKILGQIRSDDRRLVVCGPRGVGLTYLGGLDHRLVQNGVFR